MTNTTKATHKINTLVLASQAIIGATLEAQPHHSTDVAMLPLHLQDTLMDFIFDDEQFEARGVHPVGFPDLLFGARPSDVHNIKLNDILDYDWEPHGNVGCIETLIDEGSPLIVLSHSLVFNGYRRLLQ